MVYVISKAGQPVMPTKNHAKVRLLLNSGKARVVNRCPFTIQLTGTCKTFTQEVSLGVDAGSKHIGLSATTKKSVLFEADATLRNNIVDLLSSRRELRRSRRNRKTRYRKARFNNRVHYKKAGWLAPSVENKIYVHLKLIADIHKILPVDKIIVEVASFDIQKIKNPAISGEGYQNGEQYGFSNTREYVLFRDGHTCQCCRGKSKDKVLNVHHIESRKTGGNAPNNLITLCETCHTNYHKGLIELPKNIKRGMSFKDATFMGIMRWALYNKLKETYSNVSLTYGYITKARRIENSIEKSHTADAYCITNNLKAERLNHYFLRKQVRRHNRKLHKEVPAKGGVRKRTQAGHFVKGFCLHDTVEYNNKLWFIGGLRQKGSFVLKYLFWNKVEKAHLKIKFLQHNNSYLESEVNVASISTL